MRNKLIEELKGFRTPICEGIDAKLPYAEALADYLLENGVIKELTEENERLRAENETLKVATNDQYAHLCDCHDNIAEMLRQKEAYTVMKMHSMLCEGRVSNDTVVIVANQIAKEMLEGVK
jgi:hypothetical protein